MLLAENIYELAKHFSSDEKYGWFSQIKIAEVSISSTIAEGAARKGDKEFIQFLYIAMCSLSELETQLILSDRLQFVNSIEIYLNQIDYMV